MPKINVNSLKFKIYFLFILSHITIYSRKSLRHELKSDLMSCTMAFLNEKNYMIEKANYIIAHNFKNRFIQNIAKSKKISNINLIKIKSGKIAYIKEFKHNKYSEKIKISKPYYERIKRIIFAKNRYIFTGFGRDKSDHLIVLRVIYRLLNKKNGYIIILNKHITSAYLKKIKIEKHLPVNFGIYYGSVRSAISFSQKQKYEGIGQRITKKQSLVLKNGASVYTSLSVKGTPFYIYNVPIRNYYGKIIGIFGVGITKYKWFSYLLNLYKSIILFIVLYFIATILIFII